MWIDSLCGEDQTCLIAVSHGRHKLSCFTFCDGESLTMRSLSLSISFFILDVSRGNGLGRSTREERRTLPGHQERMLVVDHVLWGVLVVFRKAESTNECYHQQPRKPYRGTRKGESKSNPTPPFLPQPHQFCGKSFLDRGLEHTLGGSTIQEEDKLLLPGSAMVCTSTLL